MSSSSLTQTSLDVNAESRFYRAFLWHLPAAYLSMCPNRMTLLYFIVGALDLLGTAPEDDEADRICNWILHQQVTHNRKDLCGGFRGGSWLGLKWNSESGGDGHQCDEGHIAMTFTALALLRMLGRQDLSSVDRRSIISSLRYLQREDGSFSPSIGSEETDARFVYCACVISTFLNDWSGVDREAATKFVLNCLNFDGAFGLRPGLEGHGGSTYVSVASLCLMGTLERLTSTQRSKLLRWCLYQQGHGFSGRVNKGQDSCYSFWVGATIELLNATHMTAVESNRDFVFSCKSRVGGFGKMPSLDPDLLHSFYSTAGLSIMNMDSVSMVEVSLGIGRHRCNANKQGPRK